MRRVYQQPVIVLLSLFLLLVAVRANAVPMDGLYDAVVPVVDTSVANREPALVQALSRVLIRVTGSSDVLEREGIDQILANAGSLVQAYQYRQSTGIPAELQLEASFGAVGVTRALAELGVPVWGANRPSILAWVAVQSRSGRELAARGEDTVWTAAMKDAAHAKGLPLVLPVYDQKEQQLVSLSDIWGLFMSPIERASEGYRSDLVGVARISGDSGAYRARWALRGAGLSLQGEAEGVSPSAVTQAVAGAWAEALAARYAIDPASDGTLQRVDVVIDGVAGLSQYAEIRKSLAAMEPVSEAAPVRVHGDSLRIRLAFNGELDLLREHLALERRLHERQQELVTPRNTRSPQPQPQTSASGATTADGESTPAFLPIPEPGQPLSGTGLAEPARAAEENFKSLYPVLYFTWNPEAAN